MVAAVTLKELKGVILPTAPVNVVVPDPPAIINPKAPLSVLPNVTLALLDVIVLAPVNRTA